MNSAVVKDLLPGPDGIREWSALHCRPRCEKKVAEYCSLKGYSVFLPQLNRTHRYGKRVRSYRLPLFPGYVFAFLDQPGRSLLRYNDQVANLLLVHDQDVLVRQLNQVKCALDHQAPVELIPHFKAGMKVKVQFGPLKGAEGFIEKLKSNTRIILNVDFIQQSIAVEMNADWLIPH